MFTKQSLSVPLCIDALQPLVYIQVSLEDLMGTTQTQLESATCLWYPQLWKHFWSGWSHRTPGVRMLLEQVNIPSLLQKALS